MNPLRDRAAGRETESPKAGGGTYRRQFVFGPRAPEAPAEWNRVTVDGAGVLAAHPDLEVVRAEAGDRRLVLVGYLLDPARPRAGSAEIVEGMAAGCRTVERIVETTADFGGRWVLIAKVGERAVLFGDAAGLRQVYYAHSPGDEGTWCASRPEWIARRLHLAVDPEAEEFMRSRASGDGYDPFKVYWWPGDTSPYREIRCLLPNHSLDLRTGTARRAWSNTVPDGATLRDSVSAASGLIRGLMRGAASRYPLALGMTAGWDSRLMLAAAREHARDLYCYTMEYPGLKGNRMDVVIPAKLMRKLGIPHHVIRYPEVPDEEFRSRFRADNPSLVPAYCADAQAMCGAIPGDRVLITGDVAEVVKCYFRKRGGSAGAVTAHDLAKFTRMGTHPFALRAFEAWLATADAGNVDVLDLFSWEQFGGRLQAQNQAECDIGFESFAPYNCRKLLTTLLSLDERYRRPPEHAFHRKWIADLWKELLSEPINPPERMNPKYLVQSALIRLHLYRAIPESAKAIARRILGGES